MSSIPISPWNGCPAPFFPTPGEAVIAARVAEVLSMEMLGDFSIGHATGTLERWEFRHEDP